MARAIAAVVSTVRRSSRIQQQKKPSEVVASASTPSSSTNRRGRKPPPRKRKGTTSRPTTPFPLLRLPREIRDMIYTLLVSTGDLSIQRTSREINLEVKSIFYRTAICRQRAGYCLENENFSYPTSSDALIQNFEIRCYLARSPSPRMREKMRAPRGMITSRLRHFTFRSASRFGRSYIRRNRMTIELEFGTNLVGDAANFVADLLDRPGRFIGFRHLVVKVPPMPSGWKDEDKTRIIQVVRDILEPRLGPAVLNEGDGEGDDGDCIEFRPWSLVGEKSRRLEPVLFLKRDDWDGDGRDGDEDSDDE